MNNVQNHTLSILFWINNSRKNKNNELPLYARVTVDGKRVEISLNRSIPLSTWDKNAQKVIRKGQHQNSINAYIDTTKTQILSIYNQLLLNGDRITSALIKETLTGKLSQPKFKTICDAFDYHNRKMEETVEVGKITRKTLLRYKSTKEKVIKFMKREYKVKDIVLKDIRLTFITEFDHYLLTVEKLQSNTAHKIIKIVKKIMNQAVILDWIPSNPLNQFKCSYKNPVRVVLTQVEIDTLMNKKLTIQRLIEVRDVFVFCCYTGFAYTDIFNFKQNAVTIGIDGEYWLTTFRQKTGTKENVPLLPVALEIIEKYKDHEYCKENDKLLPVNTNQRYNGYLSELAEICGIEKKITTHIARHTFATTVTLSNGVPIETVSKMLGHTRLATTQIYAKVLEQKVSEDMMALKAKMMGKPKQSNLKIG